MKSKNKYILAVYTIFSIELLINIATMWFCENILRWNQLTFDGIESKFKLIVIVFIPMGIIKVLMDGELDKEQKNSSNILLYLFYYPIITLILGFCNGALFTLVDVACGIIGLHNIVLYAFYITALVFLSMTIWGFLTQRKDYHHPILSNIFIGSIVISLFNMFWGWSWVNIIIDIVDLIIVSLFIYLDTIEIKQHSKKLMQADKKYRVLNILKDATNIYGEFVFIWIDLINLMLETEADSE